MSEEVIEMSKLDMIVKAIASTKAPVAVFVITFMSVVYLTAIGVLTAEQFMTAISVNGLVSSVMKLVKE